MVSACRMGEMGTAVSVPHLGTASGTSTQRHLLLLFRGGEANKKGESSTFVGEGSCNPRLFVMMLQIFYEWEQKAAASHCSAQLLCPSTLLASPCP